MEEGRGILGSATAVNTLTVTANFGFYQNLIRHETWMECVVIVLLFLPYNNLLVLLFYLQSNYNILPGIKVCIRCFLNLHERKNEGGG